MQQSREDLLKAYRTMRTIREFEERLHVQFAAGDIPGFVHLSSGQEASAVGVISNLNEGDYIATTHRGHGHCIAFGSDPHAMMKEIYGRRDGLCKGKGGSIHIADMARGMLGANGIVGGGGPLCVGAALTIKTQGKRGVAVPFIGDGASNQGHVFEAMNLASVWQVPVLFVFENNNYAESTGADYSVASGDIVTRAAAFGMPGEQVDGRDYFAVQDIANTMIEQVKDSGKPALLEIKLDRFYGHYEGDAQTYRGEGEQERIRETADCLKIFTEKVVSAALLETAQLEEIDADVRELMDDCVVQAKAAPPPTESDLMTDIYVSY